MRYAEDQYGEVPVAVGIFLPGDSVTVQAVRLDNDTTIPVTSNVATESTQLPGYFLWSFANITTPLVGLHQIVILMTNTEGRQHIAKMVQGGFPSDSAINRFAGSIAIDTEGGGVAGTDFPIGTLDTPSNNVTDARTIALRENLRKYIINGSITLTVDHVDWSFEGREPVNEEILTVGAGVDVSGSSFQELIVLGNFSSSGRVLIGNCLLGQIAGTIPGLQGILFRTAVLGTIQPAPGGILESIEWTSRDSINGATIDFDNQANTQFLASSLTGELNVINNTQIDSIFTVSMAGGILNLASSNTAGVYVLLGDGELNDNKTGATSFQEFMLQGSRLDVGVSTRNSVVPLDAATDQAEHDATQAAIAAQVVPLDAATDQAEHDATQAAIAALNDASPSGIADAVWDELLSGHVSAGSAGAIVQAVFDLLGATSEIIQSTDPWRERWTRQSDSTVLQEFELFDQSDNAINTGNPIQGSYVKRRVRQ